MNRVMKKIEKALNLGHEIVKYYGLFPLAYMKYRKRNIYLISERGDDARDNGYHLFKYIRENHIDDNVYYVINENATDLKKINKYENIIL